MSDWKKQVQRFHEKHGGECYSDEAGTYYYSTGACRESGGLGVLCPPPIPSTTAMEYQLYQNVLRFHELKLEKRVEAFDNFKQYLQNLDCDDPTEHLLKLKQLQRAAEEAKPGLARARRALARTRYGKFLASRRQDEEERQEHFRQLQARVRSIRV